MRYGSWVMEWEWQNVFVIFDHFLLFYPPNNPKNQNFEKMKRASGDVCHFLPFFALLPSQQPRKSKLWQNENSIWRCHHLTHVYQKSQSYNDHISYLPEIWSLTDTMFCHFGPFFALLNLCWPPKLTFQKNVKKLEISFYTCVT